MDFVLLAHDAVSTGNRIPTFWDNLMPSSWIILNLKRRK